MKDLDIEQLIEDIPPAKEMAKYCEDSNDMRLALLDKAVDEIEKHNNSSYGRRGFVQVDTLYYHEDTVEFVKDVFVKKGYDVRIVEGLVSRITINWDHFAED